MRNLLVLISIIIFALPSIAFSQSDDSRCFTLSKCVEIRQNTFGLSEKDAKKDPLYQGLDAQDACGGKTAKVKEGDVEKEELVGFCYPTTRIETKTSFGSQTVFSNIGEFIQLIYRYGVILASIVALFMIMTAGLKWIFSAGSPEAITGAKKRIAGALMGLFLAAISYMILIIINPYLINLRLPQAWLINPEELAPTYCSETKKDLAILYTADQIKNNAESTLKSLKETSLKSATYNIKPDKAVCGNEYFVKGTNGQTCAGTLCPKKGNKSQVCYKKVGNKQTDCYEGNIVGTVFNSSMLADTFAGDVFTEDWSFAWVGTPSLYLVCSNGKYIATGHDSVGKEEDTQRKMVYYWVTNSKIDEKLKECDDKGGVKGLVIGFFFDEAGDATDEFHFIGMSGKNAIDLGDTGTAFDGAFDKTAKTASKSLFIKVEDFKKGIRLDINASHIHDIDDNEKDRKAFYGALGYE